MSEAGGFRRDLLYRLDAMNLEIPSLRERPEDLEPLIDRFIEQAAEANGCARPTISDEAWELLRDYRWPGNIRDIRAGA